MKVTALDSILFCLRRPHHLKSSSTMVSITSSTSKQRKQYTKGEMLALIRCAVVVVFVLGFVSLLVNLQSIWIVSQGELPVESSIKVEYIEPQSTEILSQGEHEKLINGEHLDFSNLSPSVEAFVNENCEIDIEEWQGQEPWQRRAPAFLVIGAKKCGTSSLFHYLKQHPFIVQPRIKELLSFIPHRFKHWAKPGDFESKVLVQAARQDMYANDYPSDVIKRRKVSISFEATPDYLAFSTFSAKAILCTAPWVKIVVILRNPVDRLFSHFNLITDAQLMSEHPNFNMPNMTFEEWVLKDMILLQKLGVISFQNTTDEYFGSQSEKDAWTKYQKIPNVEVYGRPLARSMYAIQLEGWFEALRSIGRDPMSDVLVVRQEDLKLNAVEATGKVFKWLGVPPFEISVEEKRLVTTYSSVLKPETRRMLEDFYAPHNRRLYKLLGSEWQGIWDWNEEKKVFSKDAHGTKVVAPAVNSDTPDSLNAQQKSFLRKHCELGSEKSWWIGDQDENSWRKRAPYFILIGAKKAGTTSLFTYLRQHPKIVQGSKKGGGKELHSFHPGGSFPQWKNVSDVGKTVRVDIAREQLYQDFYLDPKIRSDPTIVSFDATPDYLLYSSLSSKAILCTVPWVKLMVSLRNPIDRLFSHYNFLMDDTKMPAYYIRNRKNQTFEAFVETDMQRLASFGIVQNNTAQEEFFGSDREKMAWQRYQRIVMTGDRPIARSLYALQLEEWFAWLREAGRDPSETLVVTEEDLKENSDAVVKRVVDWLDLPPFAVKTNNKNMVTIYSSPMMHKETRAKLQAFFDPYNKRLYKLLGPEWDGIWD